MRGLFFPPSHAQTCVKSNASLLTDLQEGIGCPLTSHQNMIKNVRFLQICFINIPAVTPNSPSAAGECVVRKSGTSALMPTRNMIDWYSLSGDYSVHLVRLPLLCRTDHLSRCPCSTSSSPLHTFINSGAPSCISTFHCPDTLFFFTCFAKAHTDAQTQRDFCSRTRLLMHDPMRVLRCFAHC